MTARKSRGPLLIGAVFLATLLATVVVVFVLVRMFEHRQDARTRFLRVAELSEVSTAPGLWGLNWPHHYDQFLQTAGDKFYGGSETLPESKLDQDPWLKRLYDGYAFSIDHREARGHAYMLYDQVVTERVHQRPQAGACLHCHASTTVLYRKAGLEALGEPAEPEDLAAEFNMPAVIKGFEVLSQRPYHEVLLMLTQVPDGAPEVANGQASAFPSPPVEGFGERESQLGELDPHAFDMSRAHPVSCIDCHDPQTLALRITRPGFMLAMEALAQSDDPLPHMPSVQRWRQGDRSIPYNPNTMASRQEMRSFTCGQCHVEYYCATRDTLVFPWGNGLKAEQMETFWEEHEFPDGEAFYDYKHGETGAKLFKAQHPEFEMWSQGIHARAGVSCADCHMAYERQGAMKLSNHNVRSPMQNINNACQTCHNVPEQELRDRVLMIQNRTEAMRERAAVAMTEMLDDVVKTQQAGVSDEELADVFALQRRGMWRLDFVSSENSKGFHADQEAARILAESIDYSRQAQVEAIRLRRTVE